MKVVIDLTSLSENFSGIERYALNIAKNLIKWDKNNKYVLLFKNEVHDEFLNIDNENVEIKVLNGKNKLYFNQVILTRELYKIKADKYLFLAFQGPVLFMRKGIINTIHDLNPWDYPQSMKLLPKIYYKVSITAAVKLSEQIITVSEFSKKQIIDRFKVKNVEIIYNGVSDTFNFNKNIDDEKEVLKKYSIDNKYLMCLCTLEPRKNIELLVRAFTQLKEENKLDNEYKLVLVGRKGWKIDKLIASVNNRKSSDIIVTGFVEDEDLPVIYKNSMCFVFPSLYEGFGIPVIEAMSMGVPVISSDLSALPEVVDNGGVLFKNNDVEDLKNKIIYLLNLDEENLNNLKKNGINQASLFNWSTEAKKLKMLINK